MFPADTMNEKKRTHEEWLEIANNLDKLSESARMGIKGKSPLLLARNFDIVKGTPVDIMHTGYLGVSTCCKLTVKEQYVTIGQCLQVAKWLITGVYAMAGTTSHCNTWNKKRSGRFETDALDESLVFVRMPSETKPTRRLAEYTNFKAEEMRNLGMILFGLLIIVGGGIPVILDLLL